jgi:hypothetical protein
MGWRGTLVLALALCVAGFYLYREVVADSPELSWQSVIGGPRAAPPGSQIVHLLSFDPATVTAVRLRRGDAEWRVARRDQGWTGVERPSDVDDFLTSLLDLAEILPLEVAPEELAAHGLDPAEQEVELERAGAAPVLVLLGRHNPPATGVYAQLGRGGRVVLTGALALWEFDKLARALSPSPAAR